MNLFKEVIRKNKKMILFYVFLGILINFLELYTVTYYQKILDAFQYKTLSISLIIIYGILLIIKVIFGYIENYPEQQVYNKLYLDLKLQALKKMKTIDYLEYQKIGTGKLTEKIEVGSSSGRDIIYYFWLKIFRYLLPTAIFSLIFIFRVKKELILFVLTGYIIVIVVSNIILKKLYKLKENILINQEQLNKHLIRGFMELVVFRTNKKYDTEIALTENGIKNIVNGKTKIKLVHEMFFTIFSLIVNILKVILLGYAVLKSNLSVGAVVTVLSLLSKSYEPIAIFNVELVDYKLNKIAFKRYLDFLNIKDDININKGIKLKHITGNITFKNVSFSYENKQVINNLSFSIKNNTLVALVGSSGSGKSTIIKLLLGLIKYNKGSILIDNKELKKINLNSLYNNITYLSQEVPIFDGTLRENIVFDKKVSDTLLEEVLKLLCLDKFYEKLDTELGEKGIKCSGGERQKIALARLFFDSSKIIILDEATSAIDNISEKIVMKNVTKKLKDKTIIIITHKLEMLKEVDNILVLKEGNIYEQGNYRELLSKNDYFTKLYKAKK